MRIDARVTYEGFGRRLLAGLVDLILALATTAALVLAETIVGVDPAGLQRHVLWWLAAVFSIQSLCWTYFAATPGMLLLGSQVLGARNGQRLSLARSVLRCLGLWSGLACLGVGVLWSIRDPRHQCLHDKLVRSVVVTEDESLMALDELAEGFK